MMFFFDGEVVRLMGWVTRNLRQRSCVGAAVSVDQSNVV